jgi:hypothetical protein
MWVIATLMRVAGGKKGEGSMVMITVEKMAGK